MTDDEMIRVALTGAAAAAITLILGRRKSEQPAPKIGAATRLAYRLGKLWGARRHVPAAPIGKVKMNTFLGLANMVLRQDGLAAKVDLQTTEGVIEMEFSVVSFPEIVGSFSRLAVEAWRQQGLPTHAGVQAGIQVQIDATSAMLVVAANGAPHFLFRVGTLDIVFPFDPQVLAKDSETLMAALQAVAATDRARRGPR
jgi:hypothetical protein